MQATPLWVTITGFVLGPTVLAAFFTYFFNKRLNKQESSLDESVQKKLNEQKASLDEVVQQRLDEQKEWRASRQSKLDQWIADRRSYYLPLREAADDLKERLAELAKIYRHEAPDAPFTPTSLSDDFRELYVLSTDPIENLYDPRSKSDPNKSRRDDEAVQRLRTRMCRELNYATSTVYRAARFLALAQVTRRLLEEGRTSLPTQPAKQIRDQLAAVSRDWQRRAGLPTEQQESIGEMMLTPDGRVITQFEFRQRLLMLPGWEQYTALLTFFITENDQIEAHPEAVRFAAKVDHEVLATVTALCTLIDNLDQITALAGPPDPGWEIELRPCCPPWTPRLTSPGLGVAETPSAAEGVSRHGADLLMTQRPHGLPPEAACAQGRLATGSQEHCRRRYRGQRP